MGNRLTKMRDRLRDGIKCTVYLTQQKGVCPHVPNSLSLFCVSNEAKKRLPEKLLEYNHKLVDERLIIEHDIKKHCKYSYEFNLCRRGWAFYGGWEPLDHRPITLKALCEQDGIMHVGQISGAFDCDCNSSIYSTCKDC